ncbi:Mbeg1-like protein [Paenibacillus yanchengensis]|uniref:Mbeg1-like protein n=1 Tax=Paenibacillus yanchengensis TaxID=2035833 RepID=A0ABW4YNR4_9BACL
MANIMDYLDWRGDLSFSQSPFNEVDSLILSQLVYVNFDYIVPTKWNQASVTIEEAANRYFSMYSEEQMEQMGYIVRISLPLLRKLALAPRFANVRLSKFGNIIDLDSTKQFAAMHVALDDGSTFVAFRGTDNTIVGWRENFNMSIRMPVASQYEAVCYLEDTVGEGEQLLRLGGHSKGGNLAVYAAIMCKAEMKERIVEVYNHDGPGFDKKMISSEAYQQILSKVRTIVPQSSIVGMLLEHQEEYTIVQSKASILMQHEAFSWEVMGNCFVRGESVERKSEVLDQTLKSWLTKLDQKERTSFISALFHVFEVGDIRTFEDLGRTKWQKISQMVRALNHSAEHKAVLMKSLRLLLKEGKEIIIASRKKNNNTSSEEVRMLE